MARNGRREGTPGKGNSRCTGPVSRARLDEEGGTRGLRRARWALGLREGFYASVTAAGGSWAVEAEDQMCFFKRSFSLPQGVQQAVAASAEVAGPVGRLCRQQARRDTLVP